MELKWGKILVNGCPVTSLLSSHFITLLYDTVVALWWSSNPLNVSV